MRCRRPAAPLQRVCAHFSGLAAPARLRVLGWPHGTGRTLRLYLRAALPGVKRWAWISTPYRREANRLPSQRLDNCPNWCRANAHPCLRRRSSRR